MRMRINMLSNQIRNVYLLARQVKQKTSDLLRERDGEKRREKN